MYNTHHLGRQLLRVYALCIRTAQHYFSVIQSCNCVNMCIRTAQHCFSVIQSCNCVNTCIRTAQHCFSVIQSCNCVNMANTVGIVADKIDAEMSDQYYIAEYIHPSPFICCLSITLDMVY